MDDYGVVEIWGGYLSIPGLAIYVSGWLVALLYLITVLPNRGFSRLSQAGVIFLVSAAWYSIWMFSGLWFYVEA